ncbi:MAG TPA: hypothetical protein DCP38_17615 [Acidobacteria bacterium]|nr:hypothetical protein [Acidobacteriota bacterium]MDP6373459.1 YbaK/EbsC family protein [Vicinamibacterales bacterium]HAK57274.1 hypothetical protein [Acidobacteriota bacterium]|tara:strand:- start:1854 stop:2348 length:495 start_codon:yes stop_codon:yes gene_type:complete
MTLESIESRVIETLQANRIGYRLLPHREPVFTVEQAARQRGVVKDEIVKSILLVDKNGRYVMACVAGDTRLDLKAIRACLGNGWIRLHFAKPDEIRAVTGSVQGAVAPVGLPEHLPVIFDEAIAQRRTVSISSGDPMAGLELDRADLVRVAGAQSARIAEAGTR